MRIPVEFNRLKKQSFPYVLLIPAIIFLLMFSLYPFLSGIGYSFTSIGWIKDKAKLVGLANYQSAPDRKRWDCPVLQAGSRPEFRMDRDW